MKIFTGRIILAFLLVFVANHLKGQNTLTEIFTDPPHDARPRGYWIWGHGNFDYTRMKEELNAFKEMGLGGVDIFDMGIANTDNNIPPGPAFFSDEMLDGVVFALGEAKKLGLKMGLSVSNGWNAGGDWTTPDEMLMRLLVLNDTLQGPVTLTEIGFPRVPVKFQKPYGSFPLYPVFRKDGFPEYHQDVSLVAYPLNKTGVISDLNKIIHFKTEEISGNRVNISLPGGKWVIARAVVTPLGQRMWMKSTNSNGFIMDHYSKKATKHHFEHITARLKERLGNPGESALERLYLCSFEAEDYIIWSPDFKEEFRALHGYDIDPYIPVFSGQKVVDEETTGRFLHDYRLTVSEMFVNNHYRQARDICHTNGLLLASESGGPGPPLHYVPTEDLKALGSVDVMRGEFWNKKAEYFDENGNDILQVVKNIASAAHIYGRKIVEMESFTSHQKHWQETPFELKKLADRAFCEGMTRVIYHTMPHSPKEAGIPGWSYQAGTHISPKLTWWPLSKPFHDYLARTSALLQQGNFVADVAYLYGEQVPKFASGSKFIRKTLGPGYEYDDLNTEIFLQITEVIDGKIVLPGGMRYSLLVLPDTREMNLPVLKKVEELLMKGATILGNRPTTVYGLKDFKLRERELQHLSGKIWGSSAKKQKRSYGKGMLYTGFSEKNILTELGIQPDFTFSDESGKADLDFIHRASGTNEIYFIRNKDSANVVGKCSFRVKGLKPHLFNPVDGTVCFLPDFREEDNRTLVNIALEPYGSAFIVFSEQMLTSEQKQTVKSRQIIEQIDLSQPWDVRFEHGWGFNPVQKFDTLVDWTRHHDKELNAYSGMATYKTSFHIRSGMMKQETSFSLDLGKTGVVARVFLNGKEVGTKVFPPFLFTIDNYIREGENFLVIDVANTWLNQLIADSKKPADRQRTGSNLSEGGKQPWQNYSPQPSGLMGPVKIRAEKYKP